jgi:hypothetical protein
LVTQSKKCRAENIPYNLSSIFCQGNVGSNLLNQTCLGKPKASTKHTATTTTIETKTWEEKTKERKISQWLQTFNVAIARESLRGLKQGQSSKDLPPHETISSGTMGRGIRLFDGGSAGEDGNQFPTSTVAGHSRDDTLDKL